MLESERDNEHNRVSIDGVEQKNDAGTLESETGILNTLEVLSSHRSNNQSDRLHLPISSTVGPCPVTDSATTDNDNVVNSVTMITGDSLEVQSNITLDSSTSSKRKRTSLINYNTGKPLPASKVATLQRRKLRQRQRKRQKKAAALLNLSSATNSVTNLSHSLASSNITTPPVGSLPTSLTNTSYTPIPFQPHPAMIS